MQDFDRALDDQLGSLPLGGEAQGKMDLVRELAKEFEAAKERVTELEMNLRHATEEYNIELAKALRKRIPQVGINLKDGRCSASYKSTNLSCRPDLPSKSWVFDSNQHGRRFTRNNGMALNLSDTIDPIADAIVQYLSGRYKSLR